MPRGVYNRSRKMAESQLAADDKATREATTVAINMMQTAAPPAPEPVKMFPVKLAYNYQPKGEYQAIGWDKPAVERKNAAGQIVVISPAEFIAGEIAPPPYPGVGFQGKVWKGSTIGLPLDEAKVLISSKRAERADAIPA